MGKTIGFIVDRRNYYRIYSSIILKSQEIGLKVVIFHQIENQNDKRYRIKISNDEVKNTFRKAEIIDFNSNSEIISCIKKFNISDIFLLSPKKAIEIKKYLKTKIKCHVVESSPLDLVSYFTSEDEIESVDNILVSNEYWANLTCSTFVSRSKYKLSKAALESFCSKVRVGGWPRADQLREVRKNPQENFLKHNTILLCAWCPMAEFGIDFALYPEEKWAKRWKIASSYNTDWLKKIIALRRANYETVVKTVHRFSRKNNLKLILKKRENDLLLPAEEKFADEVVSDEILHPWSIMSVMDKVDLVVGYFSFVVREAALFNKRYISIDMPGTKTLSVHGESGPTLGEEYYKDFGMLNYDSIASYTTINNLNSKLESVFKNDEHRFKEFDRYNEIYAGVKADSQALFMLEQSVYRNK